MNYELAKKLKEAGFPQDVCAGTRFYIDEDSNERVWGDEDAPDSLQGIVVPTLSELIEACGEHIGFGLKEEYMGGMFMWRALCNTTAAFGDDKETAVANLWLALNK